MRIISAFRRRFDKYGGPGQSRGVNTLFQFGAAPALPVDCIKVLLTFQAGNAVSIL